MSTQSNEHRLLILIGVLLLGAVLLPSSDLRSQQSSSEDYIPPCEGKVWWTESNATFEDFDFWLGEWQVFDTETGLLMGFDRIEKVHRGCALQQHWQQLNDRFVQPGAAWRYSGGSFSGIAPEGIWQQVWLDTSGSFLPVEGGLDDNGVMILESADWFEFTTRDGQHLRLKYRWHWDPQDDGSIHNWGYQLRDGTVPPEWKKYFDIVYRANVPGGPTAVLEPVAD